MVDWSFDNEPSGSVTAVIASWSVGGVGGRKKFLEQFSV